MEAHEGLFETKRELMVNVLVVYRQTDRQEP